MASLWESGVVRITVTHRGKGAFDASIIEWDRSAPGGLGRVTTIKLTTGAGPKAYGSRILHETLAVMAVRAAVERWADLPVARYESGNPQIGFVTWQ